MKKQHVIIILFLSINSFGQSQQNLNEQLWAQVQSCYGNFEDADEDEKLGGVNIIDDSKNGYLKISGAIGTCGCTCESTVAAFKSNTEKYTFLKQEKSDCSWSSIISSNKKLKAIYPQNFGINSFIPELKTLMTSQAVFYLDTHIPRIGTDIEVTLKIIPIGMQIKSNQLLIYNISEDLENVHLQELSGFSNLIHQISDESIRLILSNELDKLSLEDYNIIEKYVTRNQKELSKQKLVNMMLNIEKIYNLYCSIKHKTITFGWDKTKAKFHIKKRGEAVKNLSFCEFLKNKSLLKFWKAVC